MSATRVIWLLVVLTGAALTTACYIKVERTLTELAGAAVIRDAPSPDVALDCVLTNSKSCHDALKTSSLWSDGPYDPGYAWIGIVSAFVGLCGFIVGPISMQRRLTPGPGDLPH